MSEKPKQFVGAIQLAPLTPGITLPPANPKIARAVFSQLESHFDDAKHAYLDGWSDERVARETSCSIELVKKLRMDAFGELAVDTRGKALTEMRVHLDVLMNLTRQTVELAEKIHTALGLVAAKP